MELICLHGTGLDIDVQRPLQEKLERMAGHLGNDMRSQSDAPSSASTAFLAPLGAHHGDGGICRTGQLEWPWCRACYAGPCVPPRVPAPEALQCLDPAPLRPPTGDCAVAAGGPGAIWPWRGRSIEDEALLCSIVTTIRKQGWDPLQALSQLVSQFLTHLIDTSLPPEDVLCSAGHGTFVEPIGMIVWLQVCTVCARSQLA